MDKLEKMKRISETIVGAMLKRDMEGWPPDCTLLTYQPERPEASEEDADN